jgi:anaerobic selenocysteine-containing dehydrogenase
VLTHTKGADPRLMGSYTLEDGTPVKPSFQLLKERVEPYTPDWAEGITGIPAETIRRLAHEMGVTARDQKIELPITWTDCWDNEHDTVTGNPVAFHAMRGLAAHSNGFQTIRALSILMTVLGTIDRPGGFRHKPRSRGRSRPARSRRTARRRCSRTRRWTACRWAGRPPRGPVRRRRRRAGAHRQGLLLGVPAVGARHDAQRHHQRLARRSLPHRHAVPVHGQHGLELVDEHQRGARMLADTDDNGEYKIPFLVVCDTFSSETVAFADLVLPDTTYLERHDVLSMLDRPISEFDGPVDAVRLPVLPPKGDCRPFQDVLIELGARIGCRPSPRRTARRSTATIRTSSSTTRPRRAPASASWPAGAASSARSSSRASPTRASGSNTPPTTASSTTSCRAATSTCATGTRATCTGRARTA